MTRDLTHVDSSGAARMVDVSDKAVTAREARATGAIRMRAETLDAIKRNAIAKGDVIATARLAGVMGAKRTADLIPLCHPLALTHVDVDISADESLPGLRATATAKIEGKTGVEMEALTAVTVALLTIYDMAKAIDREMTIGEVLLIEKTGGTRGRWSRG